MLLNIVVRNLTWSAIWMLIYWVDVIPEILGLPAIGAFERIALPQWALPLLMIIGLMFWRKILFGNYPKVSEFIINGYILILSIIVFAFSTTTWGAVSAALAAVSIYILGFGILVNSRTE